MMQLGTNAHLRPHRYTKSSCCMSTPTMELYSTAQSGHVQNDFTFEYFFNGFSSVLSNLWLSFRSVIFNRPRFCMFIQQDDV